MPVINLVIALIVVGVLIWLVNAYIPIDRKIKNILNVVVVIIVVIRTGSALPHQVLHHNSAFLPSAPDDIRHCLAPGNECGGRGYLAAVVGLAVGYLWYAARHSDHCHPQSRVPACGTISGRGGVTGRLATPDIRQRTQPLVSRRQGYAPSLDALRPHHSLR